MDEAKWLKVFFIFTIIICFIISFANYIVDPFQQFRISNFYDIKLKNSNI